MLNFLVSAEGSIATTGGRSFGYRIYGLALSYFFALFIKDIVKNVILKYEIFKSPAVS